MEHSKNMEKYHSNRNIQKLYLRVRSQSQNILEDGNLLIIGRQVTTKFDGIIDLLGIDRQGDLVVLELKRDRTPRETLAQVLEYASFVRRTRS